MANLTITVDDEVLESARIRALEQGTSVNAILAEHLRAFGAGEEIIIARNGTPGVRLVPVSPPKRRLGRWRGQVPMLSDAEWDATDQAVAEQFDTALK